MISEGDVARVAYLARLSLTAEETSRLASQLGAVLTAFERVSQVPTDGVEPLVTPTDMITFLREDRVEPWAGADAALKNAPESVGHLFKVPPAVG